MKGKGFAGRVYFLVFTVFDELAISILKFKKEFCVIGEFSVLEEDKKNFEDFVVLGSLI